MTHVQLIGFAITIVLALAGAIAATYRDLDKKKTDKEDLSRVEKMALRFRDDQKEYHRETLDAISELRNDIKNLMKK